MTNTHHNPAEQTASTLLALWSAGNTIAALPEEFRPSSVDEGRQAQLKLVELSKHEIAGWKIAATSQGGQKHIGVDGPIEGPYLTCHVHPPDTILSMTGNHMAVAEAEFAFRFGTALEACDSGYTSEEILNAVESLHPSLEFPDSRISDFSKAGAPTLLADCACAKDWVIGKPASDEWRSADLSSSTARLIINGEIAAEGTGNDALGGPVTALEWIVNTLSARGIRIEAGQFVTTGVCGAPKPVRAGDRVTTDLGRFGSVSAVLTT